MGVFIILLAFHTLHHFPADRLSLRDQQNKLDMVVFLFPFTVLLKLQVLVQFTNCFEEKNRASWTMSSSSVRPASSDNQLVNHQFILPRLRYTGGKDKTSTTSGFYVAKTVSKFLKLF